MAPPRRQRPFLSRGALGLGRAFGIPLRVHWTLLLVLPFFAYVMAANFFSDPGTTPDPAALVWGAGLAIVLFASVTIHEFAHSLVAKRTGVGVEAITLLPIGGISHMEEIPRDPRKEFRISIVGPLTNFILAVPLFLAAQFLPPPAGVPHLVDFLRGAWILNLTLGVFNLFFPAFPMDGGRIFRSILARRMNYVKATGIAAGVGRFLAFALGLLGFLALPGGIWLLLIAFFLYTGAGEEERMVTITSALGELRVRDVMTPDPVLLPPDATVEEAVDLMLRTKHVGFPVLDGDGQPLGVFGLSELGTVERAAQANVRVRDVARRQAATIPPDVPAADALRLLGRAGEEHLLVVEDGRLVGLLSRTDLSRVVTVLLTGGHEGGTHPNV
jgi:Zn-dependent protease/predicted transcriptional regulator